MLQQQIVSNNDSASTKQVIVELFMKMTNLLSAPFSEDEFDFGDNTYIDKIYALGEELSKMDVLKNSKEGRGSQHALYINRTYFGLYSILNVLGAKVNTGKRSWKTHLIEYHLAKSN